MSGRLHEKAALTAAMKDGRSEADNETTLMDWVGTAVRWERLLLVDWVGKMATVAINSQMARPSATARLSSDLGRIP